MASSVHHYGSTSRQPQHDDGSSKKQGHRAKAKSLSSFKDRSKGRAKPCNREEHGLKVERSCTRSMNQTLQRGRKSVGQASSLGNQFHHLPLDAKDNLFIEELDSADGQHDYIGENSPTILTPSYDSTTSTITDYLIETDEDDTYFNTLYPYSRTTHDLQYIGQWTETQEPIEEGYQQPDYASAMNMGWRFATRNDVRRVMVQTEIAFPTINQDNMTRQ